MDYSAHRPDADRHRAPSGRSDPLSRLTQGIVVMVAAGFFIASVVATIGNHDGLVYQAPAVVVLVLLLGLQIVHAGPWRLARRWWPWSLAVQGVLTYLPFLFFDQAWVGIPGSFAGSVVLVVAPPRSWILFGLLVAGQYPLFAALGGNTRQCVSAVVSAAVGGIVVYGVARLADLTAELRAVRTELAERAVDQERLRFARDLHDLLGYSLSVAALKCQLAKRLVLEDPKQAHAEISEVLVVVRQAMSDARLLSSGDLHMSLGRESRSAASVLRAAGVSVEVDLDCGVLRPELDAVLATVVREAVTNMLRHSMPRRCVIRAGLDGLGTVSLTVSNDGVPAADAPKEPGGGRGIENLTERMLAVGGQLSAGRAESGWFHLSAVVKVSAPWAATRATGASEAA
ncbi:sensor histidine kinase [Kitasatospora sp. NPDC056783]|uniref:sensor histidine kinase n=1 Tax=Kitasatospora sp. NPDC056783 TaxID=3345943 RepID=UPI0036A27427